MTQDSDHRKTATYILATANKVVTTERGGQHGGAEDSFQMIADMWGVYLRNTKYNFANIVGDLSITPKDVAQMMVLLKIARNTHGALKDDDFVDQAGYTALAAALDGIAAPVEVSKPIPAGINPGSQRPISTVEEKVHTEIEALKAKNAEKRAAPPVPDAETVLIAKKLAPAPSPAASPLERLVDQIDGETRN